MSNQYDNIGEAYNIKKELTITLLQDANVEAVIKPYIRGARVLDLACGNGHHSRACIGWGASSVVGVDISSTMIGVARRSTTSEKIEFEVADCSKPKKYRGGEYDLVFAGWLLNYAPTGKDMANMFRNVALNLKDGGHFIAITPHPSEDPKTHIEAMLAAREGKRGRDMMYFTGFVEEGVSSRVVLTSTDPEVESVGFNNYYLRKSVYEKAAKEGGFEAGLVWTPIFFPDGFEENLGDDRKQEGLHTYIMAPPFAIMIICKEAVGYRT